MTLFHHIAYLLRMTQTLAITIAVEKIVSMIRNYESDTFSSHSSKITRTEALALTAMLIERRIDIGMNIDGVMLSALLDELRDR